MATAWRQKRNMACKHNFINTMRIIIILKKRQKSMQLFAVLICLIHMSCTNWLARQDSINKVKGWNPALRMSIFLQRVMHTLIYSEYKVVLTVRGQDPCLCFNASVFFGKLKVPTLFIKRWLQVLRN